MTEIAVRDQNAVTAHGSTLAVHEEQANWNDDQIAALRQMGVEQAGQGDLAVFFHVCQRTGLDPFARQIHMVGRNTKDDRSNQWVTKYTIQTGIDGYRLVADRADRRDGSAREYGAMVWYDRDGNSFDVWTKAGPPAAAKVVILKDGKPFPGVATYDEYAQTKKDGNPTAMWARMPANQLAKCAEALALRRAYPQDLSGVYTDEEMGQAERETRHAIRAEAAPAQDRMRAMLGTEPETPMLVPSSKLAKAMFAALGEHSITDRTERLTYVSSVVGREIASSSQMTEDDARKVLASLTDSEPPEAS